MDDKYKVKVLMLKGEKGEKGENGASIKGDKGDKGDPFTFDNLTDSQKQELMTNISTYMKKEEGSGEVWDGHFSVTTNITTYTDWSMLFVFANGVALSKDDYEIQSINDKYNIVLKSNPKENMTIDYVCYNLIEFSTQDYDKLPKGPKGDKGDVGPQGPAGSIENLEVGGRNLLIGTSEEEITKEIQSKHEYKDIISYRTSKECNETSYVLSFFAKSSVDNAKILAYFYSPNTTTHGYTSQGEETTFPDGSIKFNISTEWKKYYVKYTQKPANSSKSILLRLLPNETTSTTSIKKVKLETCSTPTDYTKAPEDIENEITTVNTKVENKLSNCDLILDTSFSASGTINIPTSKTYSFYTIIIKGDDNNGITLTIPKYVMDNEIVPFVVDATDSINTGYSIKSHGNIYNKSINVRGVTLTGWSQARVIVYGVY